MSETTESRANVIDRPRTARVAGLVLCGGASRRMGSPKALLPLGDECLLQRVVRLVGQAADPVVVIAAECQELPSLPPSVRIARDSRRARGPLEGLAAGFRDLSTLDADVDAAYVTGCDSPFLLPAFVHAVAGLLADHDAVVPVEERFLHPLAAVYRCRVLRLIESRLAADELSLHGLLAQLNVHRVPVERLREVDPDLQSLVNVNSREEFELARHRITGSST